MKTLIFGLIRRGSFDEARRLADTLAAENSGNLSRSEQIAVEVARAIYGSAATISDFSMLQAQKLQRQLKAEGFATEASRLAKAIAGRAAAFKLYYSEQLRKFLQAGQDAEFLDLVVKAQESAPDDAHFVPAFVIHALQCEQEKTVEFLKSSELDVKSRRALLREYKLYRHLSMLDGPTPHPETTSVRPYHFATWAFTASSEVFFARYRQFLSATRASDKDIVAFIKKVMAASVLEKPQLGPLLGKLAGVIEDPALRCEALGFCGCWDELAAVGRASIASLPPRTRQKLLSDCFKGKRYDLVMEFGGQSLQGASAAEALQIGRAMAELGSPKQAYEQVRSHAEILAHSRTHARGLLHLAKRAEAWNDVIRLSKQALHNDPAHVPLLAHIVTALRKLRRIRSVERLTRHLVWRFERGTLPLDYFINVLRAIDSRRQVLGIRQEVERSDDLRVKAAYVETLVELSLYDAALDAADAWNVAPDLLSPLGNRALRYFRRRRKHLGIHTVLEMERRVILRVRRFGLSAGAAERRPGAAVRLLVMASSLGVGGGERQLAYLLEHLSALPQRYDVTVFLSQRRRELGFAGRDNLRVVYGDELAGEVDESADESLLPSFLSDDIEFVLRRPNIGRLLKFARGIGPDIIYNAVGLPTDALIVGTLLKIPAVIVRFGGLSFFNNFDASDRQEGRAAIGELCCRSLDAGVSLVANSNAAQRVWSEKLGVDPQRFDVIPNGTVFPELIDGDERGPVRRTLFGSAGGKVIGFVGRFHNIKRPSLWIDVALRLADADPSLRFLMVGDGPLREPLTERLARSPHRQRFVLTGHVAEGLERMYAAMDVLLVTSETESFPNVVVEALGQGAYVVSGAVGDVPEIVADPRLGRVVPGNDLAGFVDGLTATLSAFETVGSHRGYRAEDVRRRFGVERMLSRYLYKFERLGAGEPAGQQLAGGERGAMVVPA